MPNTAVALLRSTHPGPAVAVTLIAIVLAAGVGLDGWRLALLGVAFAANQASVGLSNDWIDAERDIAVGRTDKPVALGWVSAGTVRSAAIATAVVAVAATAPLGWRATVAHTAFIASAWSYNAWLKRTAFSVLPYIVSFGLLPAVVTLSLPEPSWAAAWAMGLGALLGVAAHFANVLPDLDDDRATGVRGLPHRLGPRRTGIGTFGALLAASVLALVGPGEVGVAQWIGFTATVLIAAVGIALVLRREPSRLLFQLIIAAALVNVVLLATAGASLLA